MKLLTPQDVAAEGVPLLVAAVLVGNGVSLKTFLQLEDIPVAKRVMIAVQYLVRTDRKLLNDWLGDIVECVTRRHALHCRVPETEKWAAAWLDGEQWAHKHTSGIDSDTRVAVYAARAVNTDAADAAAEAVAAAADAAICDIVKETSAVPYAVYVIYAAADADTSAYSDADAVAYADARQASYAWQLQAILHIIEGTP